MIGRSIFKLGMIALLLAAFSTLAQGDDTKRQLSDVTARDAVVMRATEEARDSVEFFLSRWSAEGHSNDTFQVSIQLKRLDGSRKTEEIWIGDLNRVDETSFIGRLSMHPRSNVGLRKGDTKNFKIREITDWAFWDEGLLNGAHITRALLDRFPKAKAAYWRSKLAPLP